MSLTPEQQAKRDGKIGASFVPYLMAGKVDRIREEWMKLVGHAAYEAPKHTWNFRYGDAIEPLALDWHEQKTGRALIRRGEVVVHPELPHVCCTLDAYRAEDEAVIDCKAWSSWQKIDYICSFLTPQIIVQRACTQARGGALLIVHGGAEPVEYPLTWGPDYEAQVWQRVAAFWTCVCDLTPPFEMPASYASVPAIRKVDMSRSNEWGEYAATWCETIAASRRCDKAGKALRELVAPDVAEASGCGVMIKRSRDGRALYIKEATP